MNDDTTAGRWCGKGKHYAPPSDFSAKTPSCRECTRRYNAQRRAIVGRTCVDCGAKINQQATRCQACDYGRRKGRVRVPRAISSEGYVVLSGQWDHPNHRARGYLFEHIKVMSEMLGRPLLPNENVHHLNGVRDDNRPENLELWLVPQPPGQRVTDLVAWAREIITRYG